MIIKQEALPISPMLEEPIVCAESWASTIKNGWSQEILDYIYLKSDGVDKYEAYKDLVAMVVQDRVAQYFTDYTMQAIIFNEWVVYFDFMFASVTKEFARLVFGSINHTDIRVGAWLTVISNNTTTQQTETTPDYHSSVHIVPPSPISSSEYE